MRKLTLNEQQIISGSNYWEAVQACIVIGTAGGGLIGAGLSLYHKNIWFLPPLILVGAGIGILTIPYVEASK